MTVTLVLSFVVAAVILFGHVFSRDRKPQRELPHIENSIIGSQTREPFVTAAIRSPRTFSFTADSHLAVSEPNVGQQPDAERKEEHSEERGHEDPPQLSYEVTSNVSARVVSSSVGMPFESLKRVAASVDINQEFS